jgi:hypothetical protein
LTQFPKMDFEKHQKLVIFHSIDCLNQWYNDEKNFELCASNSLQLIENVLLTVLQCLLHLSVFTLTYTGMPLVSRSEPDWNSRNPGSFSRSFRSLWTFQRLWFQRKLSPDTLFRQFQCFSRGFLGLCLNTTVLTGNVLRVVISLLSDSLQLQIFLDSLKRISCLKCFAANLWDEKEIFAVSRFLEDITLCLPNSPTLRILSTICTGSTSQIFWGSTLVSKIDPHGVDIINDIIKKGQTSRKFNLLPWVFAS